MKHRRLLLGMASFAVTATLAAQPQERVMTLEEIYSLADSQSKTIRIFETAAAGAEQDIALARNDYLPDIDFSASASYNGDAWVSDRNFSNGQCYASPHFGNSFSVEASQVVFAGGAIYNNIKAQEIRKQISEWDLAEHRQQVYFLLTGYYLDLYKYRNLLRVYERNMEQTLEVIENMRAREAAGVALDNDITRYEVQYQNLCYRRTELANSIEICNGRLVTMLDLPPQTEVMPDTTLLTRLLPVYSEDEFRRMAESHSPALNRGRLQIDLAGYRKKVASAGYMPRIDIIAGDNLNGPITYEIPVLNNNINTWYVGIGLRFNLGNLYKVQKEISRLDTSAAQARAELASANESVTLAISSAYTDCINSSELLKTQEKSLQLARENYDVTSRRYENDLVLVTDLADADNLRLAAEVQFVNAQINVIYNYCRLLYESGVLSRQTIL